MLPVITQAAVFLLCDLRVLTELCVKFPALYFSFFVAPKKSGPENSGPLAGRSESISS